MNSQNRLQSFLGEENTQTIEVLHNCAPFIAKLYSLVNSPKTDHLIQWSETHKGQAICVVDSVRFSTELLPKQFKHSNIASFVRQLNIYGFHKLDAKDGLCFKHEFFQKDHPELLEKIKRKKNKKPQSQSQQTQSTAQIQSQQTQPSHSTTVQSVVTDQKTQSISHQNEIINVYTLRYDLNKLQNQVDLIKTELDESKMKWSSLSRKIDQMDQIFNVIYTNSYSNMQNNSQMNQNQSGYFNNPLSMYSSQRRMSDFQNDESRHRDQP